MLCLERYLGDQRASYNHDLSFKLRISDNSPVLSVEDVIIEGAGLAIFQSIFGQKNPMPNTAVSYYLVNNFSYLIRMRAGARFEDFGARKLYRIQNYC